MNTSFESLCRITATILGRPREIVLRAPPVSRELPLLLDADLQRADPPLAESVIRIIISNYVESLDGAPLAYETGKAIMRDPSSRATMLELRRLFLDNLRHAGRCFLGCPHCLQGESELDLLGLLVGLRADPWSLADPASGEPALPALSTLWPHGQRPVDSPLAATVRLVLPSARLGLAAPFAEGAFCDPITLERDAAGWRRWEQLGHLKEGREHWRYGNPGFRAILRAALALTRLDSTTELTPEHIEQLPTGDFHFIDAVYHLLHNHDITDAAACTMICPVCAGRFLTAR